MTDKEMGEYLDSMIREEIQKSLEKYGKYEGCYAENAIGGIMRRNRIPVHTSDGEELIEMSMEEMEQKVKRAIGKRLSPWVEQEISRLQRKLGL